MHTAFIDGQAGTTGLQLADRLRGHGAVRLIEIDAALRKDAAARAQMMNEADVVFLCLPDAAAVEAVSLVENPHTVVIDTSTAHRVSPGWAYGFAELSGAHREKIYSAKRIANPGCHATGFISIAYPLVKLGLVGADYPFCATSLTGYSGGGKAMIGQYEDLARPASYEAPRTYALSLSHKHLPEMKAIPGLDAAPLFQPVVCDFYSGMAVSVPLQVSLMKQKMGPDALRRRLEQYYADCPLIRVLPAPPDGFLSAGLMSGRDEMRVFVMGNERQMTLVSVFDNLGKGAAGAAVENMNLALGLEDCRSLRMGGEEA